MRTEVTEVYFMYDDNGWGSMPVIFGRSTMAATAGASLALGADAEGNLWVAQYTPPGACERSWVVLDSLLVPIARIELPVDLVTFGERLAKGRSMHMPPGTISLVSWRAPSPTRRSRCRRTSSTLKRQDSACPKNGQNLHPSILEFVNNSIDPVDDFPDRRITQFGNDASYVIVDFFEIANRFGRPAN